MNTRWTVLTLVAAVGLATEGRAAGNMVVEHPSGQLRIQLSIPLASDVDQTTPITAGRIEIAPGEGVAVPGGRYFVLTLANLRFGDFTIDRWVFEAQHFRDVALQAHEVVPFTAQTASPGVYTFSIPPSAITVHGAADVNGELKAGIDRPSQVTGTIDLNAGTFQATAVVPKHQGCSWSVHCSVDGHLTVTVSGILGPDTDGDGIRDSADNCPLVPNPRQQRIVSPIVTDPPDITLVTCAHSSIGRPTAVDLCERLPVAVSDDLPSDWRIGATVVNWTARTESGRVSSAKQQVTVIDKTPPRFESKLPPVVAKSCAAVELPPPVVGDDCDFGPPLLTNDAPKWFEPGTTTVVWMARDKAGNVAKATQDVTCEADLPFEGKRR
jgi:hypothetical protein